jgi:hypothetical protein
MAVKDVRVGHQGQVDEVIDLPVSKLGESLRACALAGNSLFVLIIPGSNRDEL